MNCIIGTKVIQKIKRIKKTTKEYLDKLIKFLSQQEWWTPHLFKRNFVIYSFKFEWVQPWIEGVFIV